MDKINQKYLCFVFRPPYQLPKQLQLPRCTHHPTLSPSPSPIEIPHISTSSPITTPTLTLHPLTACPNALSLAITAIKLGS